MWLHFYTNKKDTISRLRIVVARIITVIMIVLPMIYPFYAIPSWYKDMDVKNYQGIDGLAFWKRSIQTIMSLYIGSAIIFKGNPLYLRLMVTAIPITAEYL